LPVAVLFIVAGIGDKHRVVATEEEDFVDTIPPAGTLPDIPYGKEFIRMAEGYKFDGDVCADLEDPPPPSSLSTEELALAKHKSGSPLTAAEVQALGDMALQSAVRDCYGYCTVLLWWLLFCCGGYCSVVAVTVLL
jgi:hypothetical protein